MKEIYVNGKRIAEDAPIFLIAEAGVNHNGKLNLAKKLIDSAVEANSDAIKFQTYKTDEMILKNTPKAEYQKLKSEIDENFYDMLKKYELHKDDFVNLKNYCDKKKIIFLSTPFDFNSVELLNELNVSAYKISSGDMNNFPLLKLICSKKKPIFLSTGMATMDEVKKSVAYIKENNISDIVIFQCTTNYPASFEELNLNVIDTYKKEFSEAIIGFSDHSIGIEASIAAAAKGVKVIEKHFTIDKNMEGPDHKASLNPLELRNWVKSVRNIEKALGISEKKQTNSESLIVKIARKSIVSARTLEIGDILKPEDVAVKRPGNGIDPSNYDKLFSKKVWVKKLIPKDTVIHWEDLGFGTD